ncbi:MAG: phosphoribosylanthranilate isomerase [Cytophagales bacterium]|nr:phosphoribosylanthranilate isomerase [Cytophagales bacterium]
MSRVKLKICGMRDPQNIREVARLRPDYMGFIFYEKSKRFVKQDFELAETGLQNILKVGVFVNEPFENLGLIVQKYGLNLVQLHGDESPAYCSKVTDLGVEIIKAIGINANFDFSSLDVYKPFVKHFLFDTKSESYGGTGKTFDWDVLKNYDQEISFFLSGGLGLDEIKMLVEAEYFKWNIHAIDVNSKFEIAPGVKDVERLRALREILL